MHAHICDECVSNICLFKCGFMTVIILLSLKKMQKKRYFRLLTVKYVHAVNGFKC